MNAVTTRLFGDPLFWGSIMGVLGVVLGAVLTRLSKKEENGVASLQAAIEVLRAEYKRLNDEVQQLRKDVTTARATQAQAEFKYGVVTAYTAGIIISARVHFERLDELGVEHGQLPVPPAIVRDDLGWTNN